MCKHKNVFVIIYPKTEELKTVGVWTTNKQEETQQQQYGWWEDPEWHSDTKEEQREAMDDQDRREYAT